MFSQIALIILITVVGNITGKKTQNVLMIVSHPDDEILFGAHDLIRSNTTVICVTGGDSPVRRQEFESVLHAVNANFLILSFPDGRFKRWSQNSSFLLLLNAVNELLKTAVFDVIISHGAFGEYGHCQHRQLHVLSRSLSAHFAIPFNSFCDRYVPSDMADPSFIAIRDNLIKLYKSQSDLIKLEKFHLFFTNFDCKHDNMNFKPGNEFKRCERGHHNKHRYN